MKTFEVKFEIYGKKLKVTVKAESGIDAKRIVKRDVIFHSVQEIADPEFLGDKNVFEYLSDIIHGKH